MRTLKKLAAFLLVLMLLPLGASAESGAGAESASSPEGKTYPCLISVKDDNVEESELTLYFLDGSDVPYVALSDYMPFLTVLEKEKGWDVSYEITKDDDHTFTVHRPDNGSTMVIDTEADDLYFQSFNRFTHDPQSSALVSVMDLPDPDDVDYAYIIQKVNEAAAAGHPMSNDEILALSKVHDPTADHSLFATVKIYNREGTPVRISLADYGIDAVCRGDECYVPFQTMNDILVNMLYIQVVVTGKNVLVCKYKGSLLDRMYEDDPCAMSPELARYNYAELCLFLDHFYGLMPEHRIDSFRVFLSRDAGLEPALSGTDPEQFDEALMKLTLNYLDDGHSSFSQFSWRAGSKSSDQFQSLLVGAMGFSVKSHLFGAVETNLKAARAAAYPDGVPGYEEIGDTAFITFDSFSAADDKTQYYNLGDITDPKDTIELILYAHKQVTRPDSPVKNIVIDLSLNGGGNSDAAVAVACWFTGTASIALRDSLTGAQTIISYKADLNLNGHTLDDPDDSVSDGRFNLYCIISPKSFSCGNLVPAVFQQSGIVTLLGRQSGGGACAVLPCTTASGAVFQISGFKELSTVRNGSFYNIDQGIPVDIPLTKAGSFYDRQGLVDLIHSTP